MLFSVQRLWIVIFDSVSIQVGSFEDLTEIDVLALFLGGRAFDLAGGILVLLGGVVVPLDQFEFHFALLELGDISWSNGDLDTFDFNPILVVASAGDTFMDFHGLGNFHSLDFPPRRVLRSGEPHKGNDAEKHHEDDFLHTHEI